MVLDVDVDVMKVDSVVAVVYGSLFSYSAVAVVDLVATVVETAVAVMTADVLSG